MGIELDKWYRFRTKEDAEKWLTLVRYLDLNNPLNIGSFNHYSNCSMLLLRLNPINNKYVIRFRTTYYPQYYDGSKWKWFDPTPDLSLTGKKADQIIIDDPVKEYMQADVAITREATDDVCSRFINKALNGKGEYKDMISLIDKAKDRELNDVALELGAKRKEFIEHTPLGQKFVTILIDLNSTRPADDQLAIYDIWAGSNLFTSAEKDKYAELTKVADLRRLGINDKFDELKALFKATETYEQKVALLKEYGVIKTKGVK